MTRAVEFADQRLPKRSSQLGGWAMATQKVSGNPPDSVRAGGAGTGVGDDSGGGSIWTGTGAPSDLGAPAMACNRGMFSQLCSPLAAAGGVLKHPGRSVPTRAPPVDDVKKDKHAWHQK